MIDSSLFTVEKLIESMLDIENNVWRGEVMIKVNHKQRNGPAGCVVQIRNSFLRYSKGPMQGYFWDVYGDDFLTPELAILSLMQAPIPPFLIEKSVWEKRHTCK